MKRSKGNARNKSLSGWLRTIHTPTTEVAPEQPRETLRSFAAVEDKRQQAEHAYRAEQERIAAASVLLTQDDSEYLASVIDKMDPIWQTKPNTELCDAVRNAFVAYRDSQPDLTILDKGIQKIATATQKNWGLAWDRPESFAILVQLMIDGGLLNGTDLVDLRVQEQEQPAVPQAQPQQFDDLDNQSAKSAVLASVQGDARSWYDAFAATLQRDFNHYLTDSETAAIVRLLERGLNYRRCADWHTARKACVKAGTLASLLLYPAEIFDDQIENMDLSDFESKQAYAREFQRLRQLEDGGAAPQFAPQYT
jgi:hypothetical protein